MYLGSDIKLLDIKFNDLLFGDVYNNFLLVYLFQMFSFGWKTDIYL